MSHDFSALSFQVHSALRNSQIAISHGHVQQIVASLLGYKSLASLQSSGEEEPGITGADYFIPDFDGAERRAFALGYEEIQAAVIADIAIKAIASSTTGGCPAYFSAEEFFEEVAWAQIDNDVTNNVEVASQMAMTNAGLKYVHIEPENLKRIEDADWPFWRFRFKGVVEMEQYEDKMFFGNRVDFEGEIIYPLAGRRCVSDNADFRIESALLQRG